MEESKHLYQLPSFDNRQTLPSLRPEAGRDNTYTSNNMTLYQRRKLCAEERQPYGHQKVIDLAALQRGQPVSSYLAHFVISVILLLSATVTCKCQQTNYCPKSCNCDDQTLVIHCRGSLDKGQLGIPLTLNPNAETLIINNAQTSQLTGVDSVEKLKVLDLSLNRLSMIDFSDITRHSRLTTFNASHNSISELKDSLVTSLLVESELSMHNFDKYDERELELRRKWSWINVVKFDLSHNSLAILRNLTFIRWHKLQNLDLSYNQLSILENNSLFGLTNLEKINLRANRLIQLPTPAFHGTLRAVFSRVRANSSDSSPLKYLDLSENPLLHIDDNAFSTVGKAREIYLESCSIRSINDLAFEGLRSLQTLSLDKNMIQEVPSRSFHDLSALKVLTLNENNISSIKSNTFSYLVSLQELQLDHNSLRVLEAGAFTGLSNLLRLRISHNPNLIMVKSSAFDDLPSLASLDLQSNSLPYIPADMNYNSLALIDLRDNPLECGCDLKWLTSWLKRLNETSKYEARTIRTNYLNEFHDSLLVEKILNLTCSGPAALAGQAVIDLPISKLECLDPSSELNILIGYVALFAIPTVLLVICMINFVQNKKHLLTLLKKNLVQSHVPTVSPYTLNLPRNSDNFKKETHFYSSDYENIDYGPQAQIYSAQGDPIGYHCPQQQYSQHI